MYVNTIEVKVSKYTSPHLNVDRGLLYITFNRRRTKANVMAFLAKLFQIANKMGFYLIEGTLMDCFVTQYIMCFTGTEKDTW